MRYHGFTGRPNFFTTPPPEASKKPHHMQPFPPPKIVKVPMIISHLFIEKQVRHCYGASYQMQMTVVQFDSEITGVYSSRCSPYVLLQNDGNTKHAPSFLSSISIKNAITLSFHKKLTKERCELMVAR